jgi:hypothetical protein
MHICVENFHEVFMKPASDRNLRVTKSRGKASAMSRQHFHLRYNDQSSGSEQNGNQGQKWVRQIFGQDQ